MAEVILKHIAKAYAGGLNVIRDLNIDVKDREFVVLVGPSGCGKSTLLPVTCFSTGNALTTWHPKTATLPWCFRTTPYTRT